MRISDWSSDVCSSDLLAGRHRLARAAAAPAQRIRPGDLRHHRPSARLCVLLERFSDRPIAVAGAERHLHDLSWKSIHSRRIVYRRPGVVRSEEHTSELQSLMRISYAVFCLKKKKNKTK